MARKKLSAKEVVTHIRSGKADSELMQIYGLSGKGLQALFQKLLEMGAITSDELSQRPRASNGPTPGAQQVPAPQLAQSASKNEEGQQERLIKTEDEGQTLSSGESPVGGTNVDDDGPGAIFWSLLEKTRTGLASTDTAQMCSVFPSVADWARFTGLAKSGWADSSLGTFLLTTIERSAEKLGVSAAEVGAFVVSKMTTDRFDWTVGCQEMAATINEWIAEWKRERLKKKLARNLGLALGQVMVLFGLSLFVELMDNTLLSRRLASCGLWALTLFNFGLLFHTAYGLVFRKPISLSDKIIELFEVKWSRLLLIPDIVLLAGVLAFANLTRWKIGLNLKLLEPWFQ